MVWEKVRQQLNVSLQLSCDGCVSIRVGLRGLNRVSKGTEAVAEAESAGIGR